MTKTISEQMYEYCRYNISWKANKLLKSNEEIDLLHNEGYSFLFVIKNRNAELLFKMIEYYMKDINPIPRKRTLDENLHVHKLKVVIEDIEERMDIPEALEGILRPYSSYSNSSESDEDSQVFDLEEFTEYASAYEPGENNGLTKNMLDALGQDSNIDEV